MWVNYQSTGVAVHHGPNNYSQEQECNVGNCHLF